MSNYRPKIYGASKTNLYNNWLQFARDRPDIELVSRWPSVVAMRNGQDCDQDGNEAFQAKCWIVDFQDIQRCDALIMITPPIISDHLRGALVEAGYALALGKPVYTVGQHPDLGTWSTHPMVKKFETVPEATNYIVGIYA